MRRITGCLPLAAALLVLAGCGDDSDDGSAGSTAAPSAEASDESGPGEETTEPAADATCTDGPPEAVVTDAGDEPRTLMELSPTAGDTTAVDMRMTMNTTASVDGEESPSMPTPPMLMGMVLTIDDVTDDEITMTVAYDRIEVEGGDPSLQSLLDSMVGVTGTVTTTRSGAFVDGKLDTSGVDPTLAPTMQQLDSQLANLAVPLPTEPVGIGATWDVATAVDSQGFTFCNTFSYTLTSFDGDAYELGVEMAQHAEPTTIEQGGASVELIEAAGSGTGTSAGRLSFPIAGSGSSDTSTSIEMAIDDGSTQQTLDMDMDIQLELSPRE
ncbi:hypothetical protein E1262_19795 [Jiangella aurantiaca]|uniref:LppX_LprAFG lipoprotein n=1 Tax=Jiangella aurantiaca TaxID=2530373 RepID=A0A4R5A5G4_9ACTN|nr:hypothetical protein [Jiangella aurantiaca]TDD67181.1 hypothetical protein E1262_19795 [Jiangella aurantiaca]